MHFGTDFNLNNNKKSGYPSVSLRQIATFQKSELFYSLIYRNSSLFYGKRQCHPDPCRHTQHRTGNDPRADIMHFDRMLPFFKKDPGISNTTGERFCLFSINKNVPSPAVWNRQLQNLIFGYADPALDTVCTLFYICHRFFSPLFCLFFDKTLGNTINLHLFQLISM